LEKSSSSSKSKLFKETKPKSILITDIQTHTNYYCCFWFSRQTQQQQHCLLPLKTKQKTLSSWKSIHNPLLLLSPTTLE